MSHHLLLPCFCVVYPAGGKEEDLNAELGVGGVAADAELDAMKEEVRGHVGQHLLLAAAAAAAAWRDC